MFHFESVQLTKQKNAPAQVSAYSTIRRVVGGAGGDAVTVAMAAMHPWSL